MKKKHTKFTKRQMSINGRSGSWSIAAWCSQQCCSIPTFYTLPVRPRMVKIGPKLVRILESPSDYNKRVLELQQAEAQSAVAA